MCTVYYYYYCCYCYSCSTAGTTRVQMGNQSSLAPKKEKRGGNEKSERRRRIPSQNRSAKLFLLRAVSLSSLSPPCSPFLVSFISATATLVYFLAGWPDSSNLHWVSSPQLRGGLTRRKRCSSFLFIFACLRFIRAVLNYFSMHTSVFPSRRDRVSIVCAQIFFGQ